MARAVGLEVGAIVRAALAIADAEGIDALRMRRLSAALSVSPMSIYHHVGSKEALLDLVIDQSMASLPDVDPIGEPDPQLRAFFLAFHHLLVTHPWLAQAMAARPLEGPVAIAKGEQVLAALRRHGLDDDAAAEAFLAAFSFTLGASLYRVSRTTSAGRRTFPAVDATRTPTVHQVRQILADAILDDDYVLRGLDKLLTANRQDSRP